MANGEFHDMDVRIVVNALLGALNWTSRLPSPTPKRRRIVDVNVKFDYHVKNA